MSKILRNKINLNLIKKLKKQFYLEKINKIRKKTLNKSKKKIKLTKINNSLTFQLLQKMKVKK